MVEAMKKFCGLNELFLICTLLITLGIAYYQVQDNRTIIEVHGNKLESIEKREIRTFERLHNIEGRQDQNDLLIERLDQSLNELNLTIAKLSVTLENMNDNRKGP